MPDIITRRVLQDGSRRAIVRAELHSDGTGTTDGVLVNKSELSAGPSGTSSYLFVIERIEYNVDGMQVVLEFDHDVDDHIVTLSGNGIIDFYQNGKFQGYIDPNSTGGTGNIIGTTVGHSSGDKATIIFHLRKK